MREKRFELCVFFLLQTAKLYAARRLESQEKRTLLSLHVSRRDDVVSTGWHVFQFQIDESRPEKPSMYKKKKSLFSVRRVMRFQ